MGLAIFRATGNQGYTTTRHANYTTGHDAPVADLASTGVPVARNFLDSFDNQYVIARGFLDFLTSTLGGVSISAARVALGLSSKGEFNSGYSDLYIVEGVHHIPIVVADYGAHLLKTISGGSIAYANITSGVYTPTIITLNATGLAWLNPLGTTLLCLRLISDINAWVPLGEPNSINIYGGVGYNWSFTKAASGITVNSATLNAIFRSIPSSLEVSYEGSNPTYPRVRFQYGLTTAYGNDTPWQYGTPMFTDYMQNITGLSLNTLYHFRAQCEDEGGLYSGDDATFTTLSSGIGIKSQAHLIG